jgi:hypothetical protein
MYVSLYYNFLFILDFTFIITDKHMGDFAIIGRWFFDAVQNDHRS